MEQRERNELDGRTHRYREGAAAAELDGRVVIVVDDGLATGGTARAALECVRRRGAAHIVLAVPVGAGETVDALTGEVDEIVCLLIPEEMFAVGAWYDDFSPTTDEEVVALLGRARDVAPTYDTAPSSVDGCG